MDAHEKLLAFEEEENVPSLLVPLVKKVDKPQLFRRRAADLFLPVVPFEAAARQGDFDGRHSFRESFFPFRPLFRSLSFFARRFVRRSAKIAQRNPALVVYAKMEL